MTKVLVNLYTLKNINCGLGQVALNMGKNLSGLPNASDFTFYVPPRYSGYFGNQVKYISSNIFNKHCSLFSKKYEVMHLIHQMSGRHAAKSEKLILTIHDLNFIFEKKNERKRNKYLRKVQKNVDRADVIVYISGFAKKMSEKYLKIPSLKLQKVIYNGVEVDVDKAADRPDFLPEGEFIFTIGEIMAKKNFAVLIDFLKKLTRPYNLIIAGKSSTKYAGDLLVRLKEEGLESRVILPGVISEDDKIYLYRHCKAFVFPSLYEGFGLPVIEAMRFGKPVFISTSTSLPEIGGEFAFYWEHFEPQYMADVFEAKMKLYELNPDYPQKLRKYSNKFLWEENINEYNKLYKDLTER